MNTTQLQCFIAVAETLSFAAASRKLSVTQPAVTQQIRALEDELGAKLFERTTRSVKLTPAGFTFLADARSMISICERARERFSGADNLDFIPFSIGAQSHAELSVLPSALHAMKAQTPTLAFSFQVFPFPYLADRMREGAFDVILAFEDEGRKKKLLRFRALARLPIACVTSRAYAPAADAPIPAAALTGESLVLLDPLKHPSAFDRFQHGLLADRKVSDMHFCETIDAALLLARSGCGAAVLPLFPSLASDETLCCRPLADIAPLSYGVRYMNLTDKPLVRAFLDQCAGMFIEN